MSSPAGSSLASPGRTSLRAPGRCPLLSHGSSPPADRAKPRSPHSPRTADADRSASANQNAVRPVPEPALRRMTHIICYPAEAARPRPSIPRTAPSHVRLCRVFGDDSVSGYATISYRTAWMAGSGRLAGARRAGGRLVLDEAHGDAVEPHWVEAVAEPEWAGQGVSGLGIDRDPLVAAGVCPGQRGGDAGRGRRPSPARAGQGGGGADVGLAVRAQAGVPLCEVKLTMQVSRLGVAPVEGGDEVDSAVVVQGAVPARPG